MTKSDAARMEEKRAAELEALDAADAKDKAERAHMGAAGQREFYPQGKEGV